MHRTGGGPFILLFIIGAGVIGTVRVLVKKTVLLAKWHAIVFIGIPAASYFYSKSPYKMPNFIKFPLVAFFFILWLFSGIEIYRSTNNELEEYSTKEYFDIIYKMFLISIGLGIFYYFIDKYIPA